MNNLLKYFLFISLIITFSNCKEKGNPPNYTIPNKPVNLNVNLDLPLYIELQNQGKYQFFPGGFHGIIVIHDFDDTYKAFERACTYNSNEDCAILQIDTGKFQFKCGTFTGGLYKKCCDSKFFFNGQINKGPAQLPLKPYRVIKSGNTLQIVN